MKQKNRGSALLALTLAVAVGSWLIFAGIPAVISAQTTSGGPTSSSESGNSDTSSSVSATTNATTDESPSTEGGDTTPSTSGGGGSTLGAQSTVNAMFDESTTDITPPEIDFPSTQSRTPSTSGVNYGPYCGDGQVNQDWEQCDGGNNCTEQCQVDDGQCRVLALARVNVDVAENFNNGDVTSDIYLGTSTSPIPQGAWFLLYQGGMFATDPEMDGDYADVPGLAVQRLANDVRLQLFGSHAGRDAEHVEGHIEFWGTTAVSQTNDDQSEGGQNKLEKESDGIMLRQPGQDEIRLNNGKSYFWLTVAPFDDSFFTHYDDLPICDVSPQCLVEGHKYNSSGTPLEGWTIGLGSSDEIATTQIGTSTTGVGADDPWTIATDVTDANGYYCIEIPSTANFGDNLHVFEDMQDGWEAEKIVLGATTEMTPAANEFFDAFVTVSGLPTVGPLTVDFYNRAPDGDGDGDGGGNGNGGGGGSDNGGGRRRSGSNDGGEVLGESTDDDGEVLQVSQIPDGAPLTGFGGMGDGFSDNGMGVALATFGLLGISFALKKSFI